MKADCTRLQGVRIVLVEPSHPGNIGAVARAMKTMGLSALYLVAPRTVLDKQTLALAAGADDVIQTARVVDRLEQAIADCGLVVGLSARTRTLPWPLITPRACSELLLKEVAFHPVSLLFGPEQSGLTNEMLQQCHYQVTIPAEPHYCSLNLAMAVQILAYEIYGSWQQQRQQPPEEEPFIEYPTVADLENFYRHLEKCLKELGFIRRGYSGKVVNRLRRLLTRARLEQTELNTLHGILTAIERMFNGNKLG